jgi:hypothetical protein
MPARVRGMVPQSRSLTSPYTELLTVSTPQIATTTATAIQPARRRRPERGRKDCDTRRRLLDLVRGLPDTSITPERGQMWDGDRSR